MENDCISRRDAIELVQKYHGKMPNEINHQMWKEANDLPSAQPEIIRCKDCKLNPKYEWFGCPMSHLSEKQRPETAWCWKAERRTDGSD